MLPDTQPVTAEEAELSRSTLDFPVVGIGASAGGLAALLRFFENMPSDSGMAFVVILHLSPKHASSLDAVLRSVTKMTVVQVNEPMPIDANHVYVIPPTKHLSMNDSQLRVADAARPRGRHVAIDLFFRSLAVVHRERSIGIVMSGTGSDGAVGIARVKEQGGITFAQSPDDAEFDGMPRAAIGTEAIDFVLPAVEMPQKLVEIWLNARRIELPTLPGDDVDVDMPANAEAAREADAALRAIMETLRRRTGHDFKHYKRATVLRRLERRLQVNALPSLPAYREHLHDQPEEAQALLKDLLIGVTNFFRDHDAFDALERDVLPELFDAAARAPGEPLRAWIAGCATGEEAYSVAMLLQEQAERASALPPPMQVFATDIDERAIASARAGCYPLSIVADVSPARLRRFFVKEGNFYRVRKELREQVLFAPHNLLRDPPFSRLNLVCCRNLLIYLHRDVHPRILETFHFALRPGGVLFIGSAETADAAPRLFAPIDRKHRIYRANAAGRTQPLPAVLPVIGGARLPSPKPQPAPQRVPYAELHQRLVEQYAPPSVLIDAQANIVHMSGQVARFLRIAGNVPSHHLPSLVHPELRIELRTALFQAQQSGKSVEARRVQVDREHRLRYVNMTVRPVQDETSGERLVLVLFDEVEDSMVADARASGADAIDPVLTKLEEELRRTKEDLQTTVEQSETSTEELKASNEELQAINEELRSATEELETSKEELQSVNEELVTVNQELKVKVEEATKSNDDLQNLSAATEIATLFVDRGLTIKRYTPPATAIFNLIPGDVGRSLLDIRHRLDYDALADDAAEAFETLRPVEREVTSSDGKWYLVRVLPYRTAEDRIDGAVLTFVDVSRRRGAEQELRAAEERLRQVAETTKEYAILALDTEGMVTTWNHGAARMFGYADSEIIGRSGDILFVPEDREHGVPQQEMRLARESGRAEDERWHLRKDGSRFYMSGVMTPLLDGGELKGYAKIGRELSGSHSEHEAALLHATTGRAEAQAANQLKDEFLAVMSHELKNPLNLILLNAELLQRMPETRDVPGVQRAAGIISRTVRGQAKIIDDLLDLSRINTGKLTLNRTAVDWTAIVNLIAGAMRDDAERKRLRFEVELPEQPVVVHADPVRVEQIVWNLVNNALKFTPSGGSVTLRLERDRGCGVFTVHDTGRGIAPEFLPRVFGLFQQADVRSRNEGGLGIGLALVKHLAEMQGGRVEAASPGEGRGATFSVRLPERRYAGAADAAAPRVEVVLAGKRALIVDDHAQSIDTLRELLALEALEITVAHDAAQALREVERERFDIIITDIAMPGMDGYQLMEALKRRPETRGTPVIALTGFGRAADTRRALGAGFAAHLSKPVPVEQVVQTLIEVLQRRERR